MSSKVSHALRDRSWEAADQQIVASLRARCGLIIHGISDLVNTRERYPEAYPVLLDLLKHDYPVRLREFLVRALTVPDAYDVAFDYLVRLYTNPDIEAVTKTVGYESYRYALANAISVLARKEDRQSLMDFARDPKHGQSRSAFLYAIRRWKEDAIDAIVLDALSHTDIQYAAVEAAGARRLLAAVPQLTQLATGRDVELSRVAKRALKKIHETR